MAMAGETAGPAAMLEVGQHVRMEVNDTPIVVARLDEIGSFALHLLIPADAADRLYGDLAEALGGLTPDVEGGVRREITGRGVGWLAYNTARVEAGLPLYRIDFGPDSLPHETGLLDQAVSFTKGCYLGQEVVARMQSLGHPRRVLAALKIHGDDLPVAGTEILEPGETTPPRDATDPASPARPDVETGNADQPGQPDAGQPTNAGDPGPATVIGAVTSSTLSPLLGGTPVALAVLKWGRHTAGTAVAVMVEGARARAVVQPQLQFI
jgi:folate-binding protein YgfZ